MKTKRILSMILAVMIAFTALPIGELVAWAAPDDPAVVEGVTVTKTYKNLTNIEVMYIEVKGTNLGKLGRNPVIVRDQNGNPRALTTIVENEFRLYYKIDNPLGIAKISVNADDYNIGEVPMPQISGIKPLNKMVSSGEALTIEGSGFGTNATGDKLKVNFYNSSGTLDTFGATVTNEKITKKFLENTVGGSYRLEFKYNDGKLTIEDNYPNLFTVYGELGVSDDIIMVPNQGPTGTEVKIKGTELTKDMSVFFLKEIDGSDLYTTANRGTFVSYGRDVEEDDSGKKTIDVYTAKVPARLEQGRYYVVLTNDVNNETNLEGKITSTKMFDSNIFTVVDNKDTISISDVDPPRGPEIGIDATIQGRYIGTLSTNVFTPNGNSKLEVDEGSLSSNTLKLSYGSGADVIGKYKLIGGEDGVDVTHIKREITVFIGGKATFREGSTFSEGMDKINIKVPSINLQDGEDPAKPVTVVVNTIITYKDGAVTKTLTTTEEGTWRNKFVFQAVNYKPNIITIVPDIIPVDQNNVIAEEFKISIIGENFVKYRYKDKDGKTQIKQPVIDLAGQMILDPNVPDPKHGRIFAEDMKIFNKNGVEIDGTPGNDLGNKITLTIPKGDIDPAIIDIISSLKVTNPTKSDENIEADDPDRHMGLSDYGEIRFVKVTSDKTPKIINVSPNTVNTDGEKGILIEGQNFSEVFKLYMDGIEITTAKRNGTGTQITFDAPPNLEGYVQLMVQNDNGALAVYDDFLYVKTYTNPKIIDFNPKEGSANTLVDLKGQNLVPPNPLVKDLAGIGFMRLIGTRVFLNGNDINTYNSGLVPYNTSANGNRIMEAKGNALVPSDYYHSVILEDENGVYYKIYFDTVSGKYLLTDGDNDIYEITAENGSLYGKKGGSDKEVMNISHADLKIAGKTLAIKTPYAVENEKIVGNRVKVISSGELYFIVPPQPREGFYDLAIVNPDTKKDERKGNAGFYYYYQPGEEAPKIGEIQPAEGSVDGQYDIIISGENFIDRGPDQKSTVTIGGVVVPAQDVRVSADGTKLTVKVPKYPGDLASETEMDRKYVNVTVTNPGGASAHKINGFAYIIPISHPKITKLILNKGTAAGGEIVTIEGSDFRYFEPFKDANNNGTWNEGETFTNKNGKDKDGNEVWDDLRDKEVFDSLKDDWDNMVVPILPTIYFGGKVAKIKSFTASTIDIEVPKGVGGSVPVYLVNNDYGVSNTLMFNYESSNPKINSVTPSSGRRQGKDKIEMLGEGFALSKISIFDASKNLTTKDIVQVQFASPSDKNISNSSIALDQPNSGRIRDRRTTVNLGDLTISYDASGDKPSIDVKIVDNKIEYKLENIEYNNEEVFLPVSLLKNDEGESYKGYELVRIMLDRIEGANTTNRLRIDRGFSPKASLTNERHINVETPSYYTIGNVPITLINPDGGTARGSFGYKNPDSNPRIIDILKDNEEGYMVDDGRKIVQVNNAGGNTIEVIGSDFRKPVTIRIGESIVIPHSDIEYIPGDESVANRLIFKMPASPDNYINTYQRLIVENEDGGFIGSDSAVPPIYINITKAESTGLEITKVTPDFGPTAGGTTVTIEGKDFRSQMEGFPNGELKVYFGSGSQQIRVPSEDIISISFDKIVLKTPPYTAGPANIKVENPDGNIAELIDGFTYVSNPKITSVVDPDNDRVIIEAISIEGGEKIKILGSDFAEGARVVFNPVLKLVEDDKQATGDIITIDDKKYILESGVEGTEVEVINGQTITVVTPAGKLGDKGVIVINPDKGATNIYNLIYGTPEIGAPFDVRAEVVFDQFIRVNWTGVRDAFEYEIYMSEDGGKFEFIGSTEFTSYAVQKIRPNTKYQFLVRAIGKYGTSKPIDESKSNIITTGRDVGPKDDDGKPAEKTETKRQGTTADIVIGSKDFTSKGLTIDLTRGELAGVKDLIIRIPANIIANSSGKISILASDYTMNFSPSIFSNSSIESNKSNANAGAVFKVFTHNENIDVQSGSTIVGGRYILEGSRYIGKDISNIDYINGILGFTLDHDNLKAQSRRLNNIQMVRHDDKSKAWLVTNQINRLGLYTVIGSRR